MSKNKWKKNSELKPEQAKSAEIQSEPAVEVSKVDFDAWYAVRASRIPKHHHKEVIRADFKARGLGQCESLETFDDALKKYGIKLS